MLRCWFEMSLAVLYTKKYRRGQEAECQYRGGVLMCIGGWHRQQQAGQCASFTEHRQDKEVTGAQGGRGGAPGGRSAPGCGALLWGPLRCSLGPFQVRTPVTRLRGCAINYAVGVTYVVSLHCVRDRAAMCLVVTGLC